MAESIEQLRLYRCARSAEDIIYELVKGFPVDEYYELGNDLRRSSSAVSHYIATAHSLYSFRLKLDELIAMRRQAEITQANLEKARKYADTEQLVSEYTAIIKQSWGLTKWIKGKLDEKQLASEISAKDEMLQAASVA